ncbi:sensor domain-containing diguanylate cyclase [Aliivibrio sp. 1S128]|uniref:sensor domain-containing diguanylate cyclase n=1 Tax=Aliivibrio sp. 1S128 TaxID=1840085 RepID=UPI00080EBD71|nr:sensor domain-containing diguanylate cyclase [Aliivibrio sp. 1S128]OCH12298.1 diguanylate cyclase [Aliivibrio sp. 1S128]
MFKNSSIHIIASFILAMTLSLLCMRFVYDSNVEANQKIFSKETERQSILLSLLIEKDIDFIGAGADFYQSGSKQDWQQFPLFANSLISRSDSLISLQWMQKVEEQDIEQHIKEVQQVFPSFAIFTVPKNKPKKYGYVFKNHEPIYVATDIYPRDEKNLSVLGFYSSRERFKRVLDEAIRTKNPSISDKVRLLQDSLVSGAPKTGMLVYHPVFTADQKTLKGIMIGGLRVANYFDKLVASTSLGQSAVIKICDTGFDAEDDPVMFQSSNWDEFNGLILSNDIKIENRVWNIEYKSKHYISDSQRLSLLWMFIGGIILSTLVAVITYMVTRDKKRIERLLEVRTEELRYMAMHDDLTGLLNRRSMTTVLNQCIDEKKSFALICFDIDNFKDINDTYGHPEGDAVLLHMTKLMSDLLADSASIIRLGGDEFAVILEIKDLAHLSLVATNIHQVIEESPTLTSNIIIEQTISLGAVLWKGEAKEVLLKLADQALYYSKERGRNQVTVRG